MEQHLHDDHCERRPEAHRRMPRDAPAGARAPRAAIFFAAFLHACSMFSQQEPSAPARTARISSEEGSVGRWLFRRSGDSLCRFENTELNTSVLVGGSAVVVRRYSLSQEREVVSSFPLGEISPGSLGASPLGDSLLITVQNNFGKVFQITVPPGGENPEVRTFVRAP